MTHIQREARIRHKSASALRRVLEEARCEGMLEGWDLIDATHIRMAWAQALLRETVAEVQARQLGGGRMNAPAKCFCKAVDMPVGAVSVYFERTLHSESLCISGPSIVLDAPTLAEGLDLLPAAVARQLDVEQVGRAS